MERIEKVVKGLCEAIGIIHGYVGKRYWGYGEQACRDAIELLKEQDSSKHGHWIVLTDCSNAGVYCSECMNKMFDRYPMKKKFSQYCGHCGSHNDLQIEVR